MGEYNFPKLERIKKNREFSAVYDNKLKIYGINFILFYKKNDLPYNRLGVSVSRKNIGNAVSRNRAKRLIREVYRLNRPYYKPGYDFVVVAKPGLNLLTFEQLNRQYGMKLKAAGLIEMPENNEKDSYKVN